MTHALEHGPAIAALYAEAYPGACLVCDLPAPRRGNGWTKHPCCGGKRCRQQIKNALIRDLRKRSNT